MHFSSAPCGRRQARARAGQPLRPRCAVDAEHAANAIIGDDLSVTGGILSAMTLLLVNHLVVRPLISQPSRRRPDRRRRTGDSDRKRRDCARTAERRVDHRDRASGGPQEGFASLDEIDSRHSGGWRRLSAFIAKKPTPDVVRHQEVLARLDALSAQPVKQLRHRRAQVPLLTASRASPSSPSTSGGAGIPKRARVPAPRLRAVARDGAQPGAHAVGDSARHARGAAATDPVSAPLRPRHRRARRRARRAQHVVDEHAAARQRPVDRVFLGRVRAAPVAADLRGRPRRARRRSLQGGRATSACRSSASASCTRRAISTSTSPPKAGRKKATSG